jgi:hypothetical protein
MRNRMYDIYVKTHHRYRWWCAGSTYLSLALRIKRKNISEGTPCKLLPIRNYKSPN